MPSTTTVTGPSAPEGASDSRYLSERHQWLIGLRWKAIVGVALVISIAAQRGWIVTSKPLFSIVAVMALANLVFTHSRVFHIEGDPVGGEKSERQALSIQICFDLCMLTMLLHWSGGVENPFALFFVFHMAISSMLLERQVALFFSALAFLLFGATAVAEATMVIPHFPLMLGPADDPQSLTMGFWRSGVFVSGYLAAFFLALFGVVYFVNSVESERLKAEASARVRERLAQSRERLARVGELSAGVAHTVRNPLHGVLNCIGLLRDGPLESDPDARETLDLMTEGLNRIENVTQRLLNLTRDTNLVRRPTDLNQLLRESLQFIDSRLNRNQVQVVTMLSPVPPVFIDRDKVSEAVINILDNAVYACRDGGTVTVATSPTPGDPGHVQLSIVDQGEGIPAEDLGKVFDPFFTSKDVGEGSGIGLAVAQRVIEEHDGSINLTSQVGRGTEIRIKLPIAEANSLEIEG